MKLEDQVCSVELSQKLKELGIEQESIFVWECYNDQCHGVKFVPYAVVPNQFNNFKLYSAFTASELGELLPNSISIPEITPFVNYRLVIRKYISVDENMKQTNNFVINYECDPAEIEGPKAWFTRRFCNYIYDPSLANAMAKMLIYLVENKLMELPNNE